MWSGREHWYLYCRFSLRHPQGVFVLCVAHKDLCCYSLIHCSIKRSTAGAAFSGKLVKLCNPPHYLHRTFSLNYDVMLCDWACFVDRQVWWAVFVQWYLPTFTFPDWTVCTIVYSAFCLYKTLLFLYWVSDAPNSLVWVDRLSEYLI